MNSEAVPSITIITDENELTNATLLELGLASIPEPAAADRRSLDLLGPIVQFVLPSIASFTVAARTVIALARKFRSGTVIDTDENGGLVVLRDTELPRGMVIVRRGGETVEVLDVGDDGTLERLTDLLKKPAS